MKENQRCETSLYAFLRAAWSVIEPATPFADSWHYEYLCEHLELVTAGKFREEFPDKLGLIINVPPRTAKSSLVSVCWPVWSWIQRPSMRFLMASYSSTLSSDHSIKRRNLVVSRWFQERWGKRFTLSLDLNRVDDFANDHTGRMTATSVGGTVTGLGGDVAIGDDLLAQDSAFSEAEKKTATRWVDGTWSTKLNDPSAGVFVHISQRLAEDDVPGHLLEKQPDRWLHIKVPLEAEEGKSFVFPVSGREHHRKKSDILQPQRFTSQVVDALKRGNAREWAGQYQQDPAPSSGVIFNPAWWQFYRSTDALPSFEIVTLSVDCAFKAAADNDYVAIQKWASIGPRSYLLTSLMQHLGYTATKANIKAMVNEGLRPSVILIEDKANGSAVIEELKREHLGPSVIAINPDGGKIARAYAASADCEAGNVFLPEDLAWIAEFLRAMAAFPAVKHDDCVDACTQYLNWRRTRNRSHGLLELWKREAAKLKRPVLPLPAPKPPVAVVGNVVVPVVERQDACPGCGGQRIHISATFRDAAIVRCLGCGLEGPDDEDKVARLHARLREERKHDNLSLRQ